MPAPTIRSDYDALKAAAAHFGREEAAARQSLRRIHAQVEVLRGGDWVGQGAAKFFDEMANSVVPTLQRLANALSSAAEVTRRLSQVMLQAEIEAAAYLRGEGLAVAGQNGAAGTTLRAANWPAGASAFASDAAGFAAQVHTSVGNALAGGNLQGAAGAIREGLEVLETALRDRSTAAGDGLLSQISALRQRLAQALPEPGSVTTPGGFRIETGGSSEWTIYGPNGEEFTRIWGDPHVDQKDGTQWDFSSKSDLLLPDGTHITVSSTPSLGSLPNLQLTSGSDVVIVSGGSAPEQLVDTASSLLAEFRTTAEAVAQVLVGHFS